MIKYLEGKSVGVFCWILIQSVPKTFWQTSRNNILEKRKKILSKFYVIFTSLNQFVLDWGIGLVVFGADGNHSDSQFYLGPSWLWSYGSWIYSYLCNQCLSPLMLWVRLPPRARCTTLCDKVCQWFAAGRCFLQVLSFPPPIKLTATI
jgi:hypothetical protein